MATTTNITTTYAGEYAGKIVSQALLSGNTLANGGLEVRPNIIKQEVVKRFETDGLIRGGSCDFTDTSTIDYTERILTPKELQVNVEICKKDWVNDWVGVEMGFSAFKNAPSSISDYIIQYFAAKVAAATETSIWQGTDGANDYDGFTTLLAADANLPAANEVTGTTVTAANVIAEIEKVYQAIPASLYGSPDLRIYVSQDVYKHYAVALGGFASGGLGANGIGGQGLNQGFAGLQFAGVPIFMANGLPADTMIAAERGNLWFGTSVMSDWNEVKLLDMADLDGSQNIRVIMRFLAGVQYGVVEDIVTYGIVNALN